MSMEAIKQTCEDDLKAFAWIFFRHYITSPFSEFHNFLFKTLTREINKKNKRHGSKWAIAAPRRNSKSSITSCFLPIWCVVYEKKKFIIMLSDTASQAEDFLSDIKRELIDNELLKEYFPDVCGKGHIWRNNEIITNNGVKVLSLGSGNQVRGRKYNMYRPDLVVLDDCENSEMVRSQTQRDFIRYDWFNKDVLFAGGKEGKTDFFLVGTSIGKDSLLNALLNPSEYPEWSSRRFKAVYQFSDSPLWDKWAELYKNRFDENRKITARNFFEDNREEMLKGTKVLWPEGDPYYDLMVYKLSDPSGFESEKQNSAVDPTKTYVSRKQMHWEYFNKSPHREIIENAVFFGAIDPSVGKKSKKGDYSAILTLARDPKSGYVYVVDINLRRRAVEDQIEDIIKLYNRFGWKTFGIETNAFQYVLAENLRKRSREDGRYIPIKEINQYQDKKMRFEGIVPHILDGTIVFDKHKDETNNMYNMGIEQIVTFTGENDAYDDVPDCLEMCFSLAKAPRFKMIVSDNKHGKKRHRR